jgi:hypothetical protein
MQRLIENSMLDQLPTCGIGLGEPDPNELAANAEKTMMRLLLARVDLADMIDNTLAAEASARPEAIAALSFAVKVIDGAIDGHYRAIRSSHDPRLLEQISRYLRHERELLEGYDGTVLFPDENMIEIDQLVRKQIVLADE